MAAIKNDELMKNQFLKSTYNRKVRISYDRLKIILTDNISRLSSVNNTFKIIISEVISIISLILAVNSSMISIAWLKASLVILCFLATIYYLYNLILWFKEKKSIDDILYIIEQDNELDENNSPKKRK